VTVVVPRGNVLPEAGEQPAPAIGPSTVSVAVGVGKVTTDPPGPFASRWISGETPVNVGPLLSVTVTVKLPLAVLAAGGSVALQFTVVVPTGKVKPDAGVQVTNGEPATASDALAEKVTTLPAGEVASAEMLAGRVSCGAVVSRTVIVNETGVSVVLPLASLALHCTVVVPIGKVLPDGDPQDTFGDGSPLSVAEGFAKVATAPLGPVASSVWLPGPAPSTGSVVSVTVTVRSAVPSFVPSEAEQWTFVGPTENRPPLGCEHVTVGEPATASVALGSVNVTAVPPGLVASTGPGETTGASTGAVVS
jgi:hypothetical protein